MTEYPVLSPCTIQMLLQGITPALCPHILLAAPGGHGTWKGAGAASSFAQKRSESDKKMVLGVVGLGFL